MNRPYIPRRLSITAALDGPLRRQTGAQRHHACIEALGEKAPEPRDALPSIVADLPF
jgi:hypothetical protein